MRLSKKMYIVLLLLGFVSTYFRAQDFLDNVQKSEQDLSELYANRIHNTVEKVVVDAKILDEIFKIFGYDISEKQFHDVARIIFQPKYFSLVAFQPAGVIKYIFPANVFDMSLGANILQEKTTQIEARYAKTSGRTVLSGPYKFDDYEGFVTRRPVYEVKDGKKKFWGFIAIGFDAHKLLHDVIDIEALDTFNVHYSIETVYKGQYISVIKSENFDKSKADKRVFTVGDQTWVFYLYNVNTSKDLLAVIISFLALYGCIATIVYVILRKLEDKHIKSKELTYIDALTKAYNRKAVDEYFINYADKIENGFSLFYLDLNDFKPVNDNHGHEVGDKLLVAYVERLRHSFKNDTVIARMGGDEFVIIINKSFDEQAINSILKRIENLSSERFFLDGIKVKISASIGHVTYPQEGKVMGDLLVKADERMYAWKKRIKAERASLARDT